MSTSTSSTAAGCKRVVRAGGNWAHPSLNAGVPRRKATGQPRVSALGLPPAFDTASRSDHAILRAGMPEWPGEGTSSRARIGSD